MPQTEKTWGRGKSRRRRGLAPVHLPPDRLPQAVRSLENEELRLLLVALLSEWRSRAERGFNG